MGRVDGKVVVVTGAASGLGRASAALLAQEGARVVLTDVNAGKGAEAAAEIGGEAVFMTHDVTSEDDWRRVIADTVERFGRLDVLVNNAGIAVSKDIEHTTLEEWRAVHAVNADGPFLGCREAVAAMKESGGGSIVNISSIAGMIGAHNLAAYCASKASVRLLTKSVALHCARKGYNIRCNSVHPSFVDTPMVGKMIDEARDPGKMAEGLRYAAPLGRLGRPEDVAAMVLYLAGDESSFTTGAEMVVDGGITAA